MSDAYTERALAFDCQGAQLVGVLAQPAPGTPASGTGVVIVIGGPQYRAGAHRLFVRLARTLAGAGHAALRFDLRGMGDSEGEHLGFEHSAPDVGAAVNALLAQCPQLRRVVLWGLCDGASAALLYLHGTRDARVRGLCLANPWVHSAHNTARARVRVKHYYARRLLQRGFWQKLLAGGVGLSALRDLGANLAHILTRARHAGGAEATFQQRMAQAWDTFDGEILLLLSRRDQTAQEFLEHVRTDAAWRGALQRAGLQRADVVHADHTFSTPAAAAVLLKSTLAWLRVHADDTPRPAVTTAAMPSSTPVLEPLSCRCARRS